MMITTLYLALIENAFMIVHGRKVWNLKVANQVVCIEP